MNPRKACLSLAIIATSGCAAQMMNNPSSSGASRFAPVRRANQEVGIVKYGADGAPFVVEERKADAYRQMYESCDGSYEIIREELVNDGAVATALDTPSLGMTTAIGQSLSSWVIQFRCIAPETQARSSFTYEANAPKLVDGRRCPTGTVVGEVALADRRLQSEACVQQADGRTLHGPYLVWWKSSKFAETTGTYQQGQPDGEWVHGTEDGKPARRDRWSMGQRLKSEHFLEPTSLDECRERGGKWVLFVNKCQLPE